MIEFNIDALLNELCENFSANHSQEVRILSSGKFIALKDGKIEFKFSVKFDQAVKRLVLHYAGMYGARKSLKQEQIWMGDRKSFKLEDGWQLNIYHYTQEQIEKYRKIFL